MPRTFQNVIERGVKRALFVEQQERKAPRRRPRRIGVSPKTGTLFAIRNKRLAIREAALRRAQVVLTYRKVTTGETKKYVVAPYEWKYLRLKAGSRKLSAAKRHVLQY
jgi:predicted DNA-binding transcriptional regulator YafY